MGDFSSLSQMIFPFICSGTGTLIWKRAWRSSWMITFWNLKWYIKPFWYDTDLFLNLPRNSELEKLFEEGAFLYIYKDHVSSGLVYCYIVSSESTYHGSCLFLICISWIMLSVLSWKIMGYVVSFRSAWIRDHVSFGSCCQFCICISWIMLSILHIMDHVTSRSWIMSLLDHGLCCQFKICISWILLSVLDLYIMDYVSSRSIYHGSCQFWICISWIMLSILDMYIINHVSSGFVYHGSCYQF